MMDDWQKFAKSAAAIMRDAGENKIPLQAVSDFFEKTTEIANDDLRRYAEAMVWEIDGSPDYYDELLRMFEASVSEADIISYINQRA